MKKFVVFVLIILCSCVYGNNINDLYLNETIDELFTKKKPILIDFGAKLCLDCQPCYELFEKENKKFYKKAIIKYVDIQKNKDFAKKYNIDVVPCQMFWTKTGEPYKPSKNVKIKFKYLKDTKGNIYGTVHNGILSEKEFEIIIKDMGVK